MDRKNTLQSFTIPLTVKAHIAKRVLPIMLVVVLICECESNVNNNNRGTVVASVTHETSIMTTPNSDNKNNRRSSTGSIAS